MFVSTVVFTGGIISAGAVDTTCSTVATGTAVTTAGAMVAT